MEKLFPYNRSKFGTESGEGENRFLNIVLDYPCFQDSRVGNQVFWHLPF